MARSTSRSSSEIDLKPSIRSKSFPASDHHRNDTTIASSSNHRTHDESKPSTSIQTGSSPSVRAKPSNKRLRESEECDDSIDRPYYKTRLNTKLETPEIQSASTPDQVEPDRSNSEKETTSEGDNQSLANLTCAICLSPPSPLVVTKCGHVACGECLIASFVSQNNNSFPRFLSSRGNHVNHGKCPVCRTALTGGWGSGMRGAILKMRKSS